MNTVNFRMYNIKTKLWYRDRIEEEDFSKAFEHFNWYSELASDEDITDAYITLTSEKGTTCCRYTKSADPVW